MHDLGTSATYVSGRRVRGGGYWGVTSEQSRDIAAWIEVAAAHGFERVVLVGHSAGWPAVAAYQAVVARPARGRRGAGLGTGAAAAPARRCRADQAGHANWSRHGKGDDLLRLPGRSFPSFISAATYLDQVQTPPALLDIFGVSSTDAAIASITCPLLAFFGTRDDVGGDADLAVVKATSRRLETGPSRITTATIAARRPHVRGRGGAGRAGDRRLARSRRRAVARGACRAIRTGRGSWP